MGVSQLARMESGRRDRNGSGTLQKCLPSLAHINYFRDKTIWITGASRGIGAALAQYLSACGANLILSSRHINTLREIHRALTNHNRHQIVPLDQEQPEALSQQIQTVLLTGPAIDILINNAGIAQHSDAIETQLFVDRRIMEINFFGTIAMTKAILPSMIARGHGQIMTVSSISGKVGSQTRSSYSASKHAIIGYMDSLRAEVWKQGINIQVACPGWVNTDIGKSALDGNGNALAELARTIDFGISPERCAQQISQALVKQTDEVIVSRGLMRLVPTIKRLFPGIMNSLLRHNKYL